ncbi:MAG TPA: type IV pilus modification protein PilV [Burkholderiales bacterium]|nr:type IV pilus modification protein PilV [Burkholderiales bacterium]
MKRNSLRQRGFTMIEILVTIVIVAVGVLGLGAMHLRVQQAEMEAYQRIQALTLLSDMVDRINANRQTAQCYAFTAGGGAPYLGATGSGHLAAPTCIGFGSVATQALAVNDMTAWDGYLNGNSETQGGNAVGAMIGARGCVSYDAATGTYTVAVAWQGLSDMPAPTVSCGDNLYGAETKRRVVWTTLRIATLI